MTKKYRTTAQERLMTIIFILACALIFYGAVGVIFNLVFANPIFGWAILGGIFLLILFMVWFGKQTGDW